MNFDPTYIIDIIAVVSAIITVAILWSTVREVRNMKKDLLVRKLGPRSTYPTTIRYSDPHMKSKPYSKGAKVLILKMTQFI